MKEFNYKKVVIILVVLLVIQIIVYAITNAVISKSNEKETNQNSNIVVSKEEKREHYKNLDIAYADKEKEIINAENLNYYYNDKFKCIVSITDFQKSLYKLVNEGFPTIYNAVKDKNRDEVSNFYKTDYAKINSCGIMDEENYLYTAKELVSQIYRGTNTFKYVDIDYDSIKTNQNGYMTVNFKVIYSGNATINMTAFLAEREGVTPTIKFRSNSELKKLFEKYQGEMTPNDFTEILKTMTDYIPKIQTKTTLESNNFKKEYYKQNIEEFKKIGIVSENDFMNLVRAFNDENLITDDFYNYEIKLDSIKELDDSYEVKVNLTFMGAQEINLNVKMFKQRNAEGRLMEFKSSIYNKNYSDTNAE